MPRSKQWFHCSQDLNHDPEFREFAKKFKATGIRYWLEVLGILDRTDNFWDLKKGFDMKYLSSVVESSMHHCLTAHAWLIDRRWLAIGKDVDGREFIYAPNWLKYNERRLHDGSKRDTLRSHESTYPTPTPTEDRVKTPSAREEPLRGSPKPKSSQTPSAKKINGHVGVSLQDQLEAKEPYELEWFEKIWAQWPRQAKYLESKLAWLTVRPDRETANLIMRHAKERKATPEWQDQGGKFIPCLDKFLLEERWTDALPKKVMPL